SRWSWSGWPGRCPPGTTTTRSCQPAVRRSAGLLSARSTIRSGRSAERSSWTVTTGRARGGTGLRGAAAAGTAAAGRTEAGGGTGGWTEAGGGTGGWTEAGGGTGGWTEAAGRPGAEDPARPGGGTAVRGRAPEAPRGPGKTAAPAPARP